MLKIAIIGLGDVSQVHLSIIQNNPDVSLVAVCDVDKSLASLVKGVSFYNDYNEMLENETIDCVHICLPHYIHYEATKACAEKGIHVYLEKPLAHRLADGNSIVHLEETYQDTKICVSLQNRFNETFITLLNKIESGKYGKVIGIKGLITWHRSESYYSTKRWRGQEMYAGGGVLINQAIHTLDLMQLLGGKVETIKGTTSNLTDYKIDVEDTVVAKMKYTNEATGLLFATTSNAVDSNIELQVNCEYADFNITNDTLFKSIDGGEQVQLITDEKLKGEKFYYGAGHGKLIHHFYNCITNDQSNYIHAKDALTSLELVDSVYKSSEQNIAVDLRINR